MGCSVNVLHLVSPSCINKVCLRELLLPLWFFYITISGSLSEFSLLSSLHCSV